LGLIGKIISTLIDDNVREISTEVYKNYTKKSKQILPPGIDSSPIAGDQGVLIVIDSNAGKSVQVGVYSSPTAEPGEIRLYSRNDSGVQQGEIFIKKDGTIELTGGPAILAYGDMIELNGNADNAVRYSELETGFNQLKQDHDDLVTGFNAHMHATAAPGAPSPPTPAPPNVPASPSTADITSSKVDEVKLSS